MNRSTRPTWSSSFFAKILQVSVNIPEQLNSFRARPVLIQSVAQLQAYCVTHTSGISNSFRGCPVRLSTNGLMSGHLPRSKQYLLLLLDCRCGWGLSRAFDFPGTLHAATVLRSDSWPGTPLQRTEHSQLDRLPGPTTVIARMLLRWLPTPPVTSEIFMAARLQSLSRHHVFTSCCPFPNST